MLKIFYRRFYIFLFLIWLVATSGLFVISVWGDFDTFVTDFGEVTLAEQEDPLVTDAEGVLANVTQKVVRKVQVAGDAVRREIVRDVRPAVEVVEKVEELDEPVKVAVAKKKVKSIAPPPKAVRQFEGAGVLTGISFTGTDTHLTARLKTSAKVGRVTRFWLKNPTRVVVDLRGNWRSRVEHRTSFAESFMYQVVIGLHPDRLRIVFRFDDSKAAVGELPKLVYTDEGLDIVVENPDF